jgi:hypothetical protein
MMGRLLEFHSQVDDDACVEGVQIDFLVELGMIQKNRWTILN